MDNLNNIQIKKQLKIFLVAINKLSYEEEGDACMNSIYVHFNNMQYIIYNYDGFSNEILSVINKCRILHEIVTRDISSLAKIEQVQHFYRQYFD